MAVAYVDWYQKERRQNWGTPPEFFAALHAKYKFTLDGASEPGNALLPRSMTYANPLGTTWAGERVFCNPPWSSVPPFIELALTADLAVLLVPARTNGRWFHRALEAGAKVDYFQKRLRFIDPLTGKPGRGCPVDCVLLVFANSGRGLETPGVLSAGRLGSPADDHRAAERGIAETDRGGEFNTPPSLESSEGSL